MAQAPNWMTKVIDNVRESDDPQVIAKAIFNSPHIINAIRSGIAEFYEAEQRLKESEENNQGVICGSPTKAEAIRGKVMEAVEQMF